MPRYFIAIPLVGDIKDQLIAAQPAALPGMRLIERDELHLTLHFLGEVPPEFDEPLRKALTGVRMQPFSIAIQGVGRFPPAGEPRVLWAGVAENPLLWELHASIDAVLRHAIGFEGERRPYSPHITLAHLNSPVAARLIDEYFNANSDLCTASHLVTQFALYSSDIEQEAPKYRQEAVFRLA